MFGFRSAIDLYIEASIWSHETKRGFCPEWKEYIIYLVQFVIRKENRAKIFGIEIRSEREKVR